MQQYGALYGEYAEDGEMEICIQRHDKRPSKKGLLTPESAQQITCPAFYLINPLRGLTGDNAIMTTQLIAFFFFSFMEATPRDCLF